MNKERKVIDLKRWIFKRSKERKVINHNPVVVFNRCVEASELNELFQNFQGDIVINGCLMLDEEELVIQCDNLYVSSCICANLNNTKILLEGNLYVEDYIYCHSINVNGSLCCNNDINCKSINVNGSLYCNDTIKNCVDIKVTENLCCNKIDIQYGYLIVAGDIEVSCLDAKTVNVFGKMRCHHLWVEEVNVGY